MIKKAIVMSLKTNVNPQQRPHFFTVQLAGAILSYPQRLVMF